MHHPGGRVWIIWVPQLFSVQLIANSDQHITVEVSDLNSGDIFLYTVVYGSNSDSDRLSLWEHLNQLKDQCLKPWCICGDFNSVLDYNERLGREVVWSEIRGFRQCVEYCEMTDIPAHGSFFTWNNKQDPTTRSLDPNYKEVVATEWNKSISGVKMYQVVTKLRNLKKPLRDLNKNSFSDIEKSAKVARALLDRFQTTMHLNPQDQQLLAAEQQAAEKYRSLNKARTSYLQQKAKVDWLMNGYEYTNFYHSRIKARQIHNKVSQITDTNRVNHQDPMAIENAFLSYYTELLGSSKPTTKVHNPTVRTGSLITDQRVQILLRPVTDNEIMQSIFSISADKSPGPDGYTSQFYRDSWAIVGQDVCAAVKDSSTLVIF
ncbi:uncharacterized protein LOC141630265 [Silene latifolia]|uniref:uncharacterized protein LOC141630265 n=1 Tax=Silene latifolia TaxID=37657 RepID=UPI003D78407A